MKKDFFAFLFCLCGIYAALFTVSNALDLQFHQAEICIYLLIFSFVLWMMQKKLSVRLFWFYIPLGIYLLTARERLWAECRVAANSVLDQIYEIYDIWLGHYDIPGNPVDTTRIAFVAMSALTILLFQILCSKRKLFVPLFWILLLLIGSSLLGKEPSGIIVLLFMLFYAGICGMKNKKNKIAVFCSIFIGGFIIVLFGAGQLFSNRVVMQHANTWAVSVRDTAVRIYDRSRGGSDSGKISRTSRVEDTRDYLSVTVSKKPEETLYLKGFTGGVYADGSWQPIDESTFWDSREGTAAADGISRLPYRLAACTEDAANRFEVRVKHLVSDGQEQYTPYLSVPKSSDGGSEGNYFWCYPWTSFARDIEASVFENTAFDEASELYEAEQEYRSYARGQYRTAAEEQFPRLYQLCKENPLFTEREITAFIQKTLAQNASYTLSPQTIPPQEEIAEYFLFESHQGYCVHFATAGAILYRMYGIPARYVSGYAVKTRDFQEQEDGSYQALVSGVRAHAWVEIYRDGIGWCPVDVTPADDASEVPREGTPTPKEEEPLTEPKVPEQEEEPLSADQEIPEKERPQTKPADSADSRAAEEQQMPLAGWVVLAAAIFCAAMCFGMYIRRRQITKRFLRMDVRRIFSQMLSMLHTYKILETYSGLEADFVPAFCKACTFISEKEADRMIQIVYRAAYGSIPVTGEELAFMRNLYRRTALHLYQSQNRWNRWIFCYKKGYLPR